MRFFAQAEATDTYLAAELSQLRPSVEAVGIAPPAVAPGAAVGAAEAKARRQLIAKVRRWPPFVARACGWR